MASVADNAENLVLVSSLYGPGTVACWYLTYFSVLLAWTLHPQKKSSGSIDLDLAAILTFPAVATGDLIWQIRRLPSFSGELQMTNSGTKTYLQCIAAIEAPLHIVETFILLSFILFTVSAYTHCLRRMLIVAIVGVVCSVVDAYAAFSKFSLLGPCYNPDLSPFDQLSFGSRYYLADWNEGSTIAFGTLFVSILASVLALLSIPSSHARELVSLLNRGQWNGLNAGLSPQSGTSVGHTNQGRDISFFTSGFVSNHWRTNTTWISHRQAAREVIINIMVQVELVLISVICMTEYFAAVYVIVTFIQSFFFQTNELPQKLASRESVCGSLLESTAGFGNIFFPRTLSSVMDLDQAPTLGAGATALVYSIYGVAKPYYKTWKVKNAVPTLPIAEEWTMLGNRPEPQVALELTTFDNRPQAQAARRASF